MNLIQILKALSDENRIRILNLLKYGDLCVCELEILLSMSQSNVSRHLNKLTNAKIVNHYKVAKYVYYKLNEDTIKEYPFINEILSHNTFKLEPYNKDYKKLKRYKDSGVSCDDLKCGKLYFK
ncbi:ArsR/SmtB family transcription factor [Defluviitalea phaphyphila]|uniref:ArsR/SmtB family transcription factor n=1 Tax=Defluviitalea phaphyphila TaxID=1473580 RepID=UPI0007310AAB|nr:metalloregulator ArsR/SmtB family transcription factor [Defluviitalea phaphyphila]